MRERVYVGFELRPCRALAALLLALYLTAASAALVVDLPLWIRAGLIAAIAFVARESVRRHALLSAPSACVRLRVRDDGECSWQSRDGTDHNGALLPRWFATPWLTVLRVQGSDRSRTTDVILTPCTVDTENHRQLRVLLGTRL